MSVIQPVNDQTFENVVMKSPLPAMVEFGAEWCGPCRRMEPILEELAKTWSGRVQVYRVDVDESPEIATQLQVMSVPTVMMFVKGEIVQRITGLQSRERLAEKFEMYL